MRTGRCSLLLAAAIASANAPAAGQETPRCATQTAVMVPPHLTAEEFQAERRAAGLTSTPILLPTGQLPRLHDRQRIETLVYDALNDALRGLRVDDRHHMVLVIDTAGVVASVRPATGDSRLDEQMTGIWRSARFDPVEVRGCRAEAVLQVPLVFVPDSMKGHLRTAHAGRLFSGGARQALTLEMVADPAAVLEVLRAQPLADNPYYIDVRFAANGLPDSVRIDPLGPDTTRNRTLEALIRPLLRRIDPDRAPNGLALFATAGPRAAVRPVREQPPRLTNSDEMRRALEREFRGMPAEVIPSGQATVIITLVVDEYGRPDQIRTVRPAVPALDAAAVRVASSMRFRPASIEGESVKIRVSIPITFARP